MTNEGIHFLNEMLSGKAYYIEPFMSGYTVFYMGDEVYFNTVDEAKAFIDEVSIDKIGGLRNDKE